MKFSTEWINDYLSRTMSVDEIVAAIDQSGIEIEQVISSNKFDEKIITGLIKSFIQHPGADNLKLVEVDAGSEILRIVCGAPNVKVGSRVALALIGAKLPDGTKIKKSKIRGQESFGMLCSSYELGLDDNHDGIILLDDDTEIGVSLCDTITLPGILDIKTAANRPDLNSVIGVAREIVAMSKNEIVLPKVSTFVVGKGPQLQCDLDVKTVKRIVCVEVAIGDIDETKYNVIKTRLSDAGHRPISPSVDLTNYVMLEQGQPLHAYDADKITLPIAVRYALNGEKLTTIDGVDRSLTAEDLVVADSNGVIGLAGVMGGLNSQVTDRTKKIILEAAIYDGVAVRKASKRHGLRTEASGRFERNIPVQSAPIAIRRCADLMVEVVGAKITSEYSDLLRIWPWEQRIGLKNDHFNAVLGSDIPVSTAIHALQRVGVEAEKFDIVGTAKQFVGRPYKFGANYKNDGTKAFDCSYLTDYLYSLIGRAIGHTAHQQYRAGHKVELHELVPGDLLFRGGPFQLRDEAEREGVSHVGMYIGDGLIIHAIDIRRDEQNAWVDRSEQSVTIESIDVITSDPSYLGARRYVDEIDNYLSIKVAPWWRPDLKIAEDLIEEVVRVIGYDNIPSRLPAWRPNGVKIDERLSKIRDIKNYLSGSGLFEVMTYSFIGVNELEKVGLDPKDHLALINPLSIDQAHLRTGLLASHLSVLSKNRTFSKEVGVYELSKVFIPTEDNQQPDEPTVIGIMIRRDRDSFRILKGILDGLLEKMAVDITMQMNQSAPFVAGRSANIIIDGNTIGEIGQISPSILRTFKISNEVSYIEIDLTVILSQSKTVKHQQLTRFPGIFRDITILLDRKTTWGDVKSALKSVSPDLAYIGDYYDNTLDANYRKLSFRVGIHHNDRTPTDVEADTLEKKIIKILGHKFGN